MSISDNSIRVGIRHIKAQIPALEPVISKAPRFDLTPNVPNPAAAFESLVLSVISQQISTSAAATISGRVQKAMRGTITPLKVQRLSSQAFRELGVSGSKARTIFELAAAVREKRIHLGELADMTDAEIISELSAIWGIGKWTAEMFLMFDLGRLDIWPAGDYGVRKGWQIVHRETEMTSEKQFNELGTEGSPYRSIAAWYCWRAIDLHKTGAI
ncbi:MAG: hypothetical protein RL038_271 [Actinomycetota bacterium]|jgi:DNA-3-methyladenine glycosylase II